MELQTQLKSLIELFTETHNLILESFLTTTIESPNVVCI